MPDTKLRPKIEYKYWYDFKRELESKLGRYLNAGLWLRTKPKKPLPWNNVDLQTSLSEVLEVLRVQQEYENPSRVRKIAFEQVRML